MHLHVCIYAHAIINTPDLCMCKQVDRDREIDWVDRWINKLGREIDRQTDR